MAKKRVVNYWYAARPSEMFLDIDSPRALRRAVSVLIAAVRTKKLEVEKVYFYRTRQKGHCHMVVVLSSRIHWTLKYAWLLWMGNDRLRAAYVLARVYDSRVSRFGGDLLVSSKPYFRMPDSVCGCSGKHKEDLVTKRCPAMRKLLGDARAADYFARTGERRVRPLRVRVPWGEVPVDQLEQWLEG